jgi:hypothetical protein
MERLKSHIQAIICLNHFNLSQTMQDKVYYIDYNIRLVSVLDRACPHCAGADENYRLGRIQVSCAITRLRSDRTT